MTIARLTCPARETGQQLLERILTLRRELWESKQLAWMTAHRLQPRGDTWRRKYQEPIEPESSKLPNLPPDWIWTNLGTIAEIKLGKMLSPKAYGEGLILLPYLRNENIRWGRIDFSDVKRMGFKDKCVFSGLGAEQLG